jgi:hypothetical protein
MKLNFTISIYQSAPHKTDTTNFIENLINFCPEIKQGFTGVLDYDSIDDRCNFFAEALGYDYHREDNLMFFTKLKSEEPERIADCFEQRAATN